MAAKVIDGRAVAQDVKARVRERADALRARGAEPCLALVLVGDDPSSQKLVELKRKACVESSIVPRVIPLPGGTTDAELATLIDALNADEAVHGILCQLPFPKGINEQAALLRVAREKDVDAFSALVGAKLADMAACTPAGVVALLDAENIEIAGKNCVVVGRSALVGRPMAMQLLLRDGTVTICHTKTRNLADFTSRADILVVAAGSARLIGADMVKEGATVIDVGNNWGENGKICGDVDFEAVKEKASYITPVPGGVGPMTIAMLMENTVAAAEGQCAARGK